MRRRLLLGQQGFTLIELLVVVLVIAILIAVAAPSFLGQTKKAQNSSAEQALAIAFKAAKSESVFHTPQGSWLGTDQNGNAVAVSDLATAMQSDEPELSFLTGSTAPSASHDGSGRFNVEVGVSGATLTLVALSDSGDICTLTDDENQAQQGPSCQSGAGFVATTVQATSGASSGYSFTNGTWGASGTVYMHRFDDGSVSLSAPSDGLFSVSENGGTVTALGGEPNAAGDTLPSYSSGAGQLFFVRGGTDVMSSSPSADLSSATTVISEPSASIDQMQSDTAGDRLFYHDNNASPGAYLVDGIGGTPVAHDLTAALSGGAGEAPTVYSLSGDGNTLVYIDANTLGIRKMDVSNPASPGSPTTLLPASQIALYDGDQTTMSSVAISADGSELALGVKSRTNGKWLILIVKTSDQSLMKTLTIGSTPDGQGPQFIRISPDNSKVLYSVAADAGGVYDNVFVAPAS